MDQLLGHVGNGAINVCALAQVFDGPEISDELLFTGDGAEDLMELGEVESSDGPIDVDGSSVTHVLELLGKSDGEIFDTLYQAARRVLLKSDGLRCVDDKVQVDRAFGKF